MQLPSIISIIFTVIVIILIRFIFRYFIRPYLHLRAYKSFKGGQLVYFPIFGEFAKMQEALDAHGDLYYSAIKRTEAEPELRALFYPMLNSVRIDLYDPELIKEFFAKQSKFIKDLVMFAPISTISKSGLVFAEGEKWKLQRKLISQVFHFDYINGCIPIINRKCKEWISTYCKDQPGSSSSQINVKETMKMYTSRLIWRMFFGEEEMDGEIESEKLIEIILNNISQEMAYCFSLTNLFFGPWFFKLGLRSIDRKYNRESQIVENFARKKLQSFKQKLSKGKNNSSTVRNLIELLIEESSKGGQEESLTDLEIMGQIMTFLIAGTDTTLNVLTMTHYFLALYPEVQQKLREEILQIIGKAGEVTYEHLSKMDYLTAILKETIRIYGPADTPFPRIALEDVTIGDLHIRKGHSVAPVFRIIQSNPRYFSKAAEFIPERWIEKNDLGVKDPFVFIPFSAGGRRCIGEQLAYIEAKIMIIELLRRYKIDIQRPHKPRMDFGLAYENKEPMIAIYTKL